MVINKEDLNKLIEIENKLAKNPKYFDEFCILCTIIEKCLQQKYLNNQKNYERIKAKRQLNKDYARPKKGDKK